MWSEIATARRETAIVEDRGWRPTLLLCLAIGLAAVTVMVAKPLAAAAAGRPHVHTHARARAHAGARIPQVTPGDATSPNWSGYVAYSSAGAAGFNNVSATWIQKAVTCPKSDAWTLFWVGFDGWPSNEPSADSSVEQGGTSARCVKGVAHYNAFYEMWPTHAVVSMFSIKPGDDIAANVDYAGCDLAHLVLKGLDLSSDNFRRANLSYANMDGANLQGADLRGADTRGTLTNTSTVCENATVGPCNETGLRGV